MTVINYSIHKGSGGGGRWPPDGTFVNIEYAIKHFKQTCRPSIYNPFTEQKEKTSKKSLLDRIGHCVVGIFEIVPILGYVVAGVDYANGRRLGPLIPDLYDPDIKRHRLIPSIPDELFTDEIFKYLDDDDILGLSEAYLINKAKQQRVLQLYVELLNRNKRVPKNRSLFWLALKCDRLSLNRYNSSEIQLNKKALFMLSLLCYNSMENMELPNWPFGMDQLTLFPKLRYLKISFKRDDFRILYCGLKNLKALEILDIQENVINNWYDLEIGPSLKKILVNHDTPEGEIVLFKQRHPHVTVSCEKDVQSIEFL